MNLILPFERLVFIDIECGEMNPVCLKRLLFIYL